MTPPRSRWYWTPQEHEEFRRQEIPYFAFDMLYTEEDTARIARYIEMCGGVVGGRAEMESLRRALNMAGLIWLEPTERRTRGEVLNLAGLNWLEPIERRTRREIIRKGKALRKAIKNAEILYGTLGTKDAMHHAAVVASDLDGIGICAFPELGYRNDSIRFLLGRYIALLGEQEFLVTSSIPYTDPPPSLASKSVVFKWREARFWDWIAEMARIWEVSDLPVDMGQAFQTFVKECRPDERRCEELSLEKPKPVNKRTVIDWIAKVRQPRERKL